MRVSCIVSSLVSHIISESGTWSHLCKTGRSILCWGLWGEGVFSLQWKAAGPFPWEIKSSVPRMGPRPVLLSCALEEDSKKVEADTGIEWREK